MKKREAHFCQHYVRPWVIKYGANGEKSITYEAKETNTTVGLNDFEPQQIPSLVASTTKDGIYYKIPDGSGITSPFDGFFIKNAKAYVAIMYRNQGWAMIDVFRFLDETKRVDWERVQVIAEFWYTV